MRSFNQVSSAPGGASKGGGEEPGKLPEQAEEESQVLHGTGHCKWFNVRMGFGFISMISREGSPLDIPVDVFVHQVSQNFFFLPLFTFFQKELVGRFVNGLKIMCLSKSPLQSRVNPVFRACSWASSRMSFLKQKIFEISLLGVG
uniref:CSD domain-containing protein n=1 Tax=Sus scrofa TaxID=9823 RepID=A0A8D1JRI6_PIG